MTSGIKLFNNESLNTAIKTISDNDGTIWFKAKDIATYLGYQNTVDAIQRHVDDKYKTLLCNIETTSYSVKTALAASSKSPIYIKEFGLYQLVFASKKPEAKLFTEWVVEDVIPSIRKTGKYSIPLIENQISLMNERDLHFKVIDFIRTYYPHCLLYAGLGEIQDTSNKRIYAYRSGYI